MCENAWVACFGCVFCCVLFVFRSEILTIKDLEQSERRLFREIRHKKP